MGACLPSSASGPSSPANASSATSPRANNGKEPFSPRPGVISGSGSGGTNNSSPAHYNKTAVSASTASTAAGRTTTIPLASGSSSSALTPSNSMKMSRRGTNSTMGGSSISEERSFVLAQHTNAGAGGGSFNNRERSDSFLAAMRQETEPKSESDFDHLRSILKQHPWFSSHTSKQIDDIARFMRLKTFSKQGEVVYATGQEEGEDTGCFYVVKSGELLLLEGGTAAEASQAAAAAASSAAADPANAKKHSSLSSKTQIQRLTEGSSFGESVLRFKGARSETVITVSEKVELWTISSRVYQNVIVRSQIALEKGGTEFLRSVPLLKQLTDEQLMVLSRCLTRVSFTPGDLIIIQNTRGSEFFIVEKGVVGAYQRTQKGDREVRSKVNEFKAGDYFGEGALLTDEPRTADCIAEGEGEVVVLVLKRDDFIDLLGGLERLLEKNFITRVLNSVEVLKQGLTPNEREEIAEKLVVERYAAGEIIIRQGNPGGRLFIIKEGEVAFTRRKDAGEGTTTTTTTGGGEDEVATSASGNNVTPEEVGRLFTGQVFGEGALLQNTPRRATARAVTDVTLLSLDRGVFSTLFDTPLQEMLNRDFTKRRDLDEKDRKDLLEFSDLQRIDLLGVGTYGQVLLVSHRVTGQTYALKCMSKSRIKETDQKVHVENERKILSMIHHPFVVNLVQTFASPDHVFALMEAVLGGELFAYLRSVGRLKAKDARFYMAQITFVFEYLHSLNIVYRDLKPENLLITSSGYVKMADFGLAKIVPPGESTYTLCGTPAYAAIEVYQLKGHSKPVDWWGLGVLGHELISGATPFDGDAAGIFDAMQRYQRAYPNIRLPRKLEGTSAGDLVLKLLHPNPYKRLGSSGGEKSGARAVKAEPFFEDFNWNAMIKMKMEPPYIPKISGGYDSRNFYEPTLGNDRVVDFEGVDAKLVVAGQTWEML